MPESTLEFTPEDREQLARDIEQYFDRLWPYNRSITGEDYRTSLNILNEVMPTENLIFNTGEKVLDWTVPKEWNAEEAYLIDPNGKKRADFSVNNLHLMGYSIPFEGTMNLEELKPNLYTLPDQPNAIPYLTSYYKERWGFCMTQEEYDELPEGDYQVVIRTRLEPGKLVVGESVIQGKSDREVMLASYLCHPSMANNELSGPLVLSFLYRELKRLQPQLKYTYRFVVFPETIGAICYLSKRGFHLKDQLDAGYQITCIGDPGEFTYKHSRQHSSLADRAALQFMKEHDQTQIIPFNPAFGSDERQWCSPGFNLPVGSLMRTMYTVYPEYHTSLDNKDIMSFPGMADAVAAYMEIIRNMEENTTYNSLEPYGEPMLGPRGLFRSISSKKRDEDELAMWWLLNYADGQHDLLKIAELSGHSMDALVRVGKHIHENGLFETVES
jgi:aminopeptidase-like protein